MRAVSLCLLPAFTLAAPVSAQVASPVEYDATALPGAIDKNTQAQTANFRSDAYDRMTVQVMIGGKGPYNFLVDTGADHTVVSSRVAHSLGLDAADPVQLYTISGHQSVQTASLGRLEFSQKTIENVNAAVLEHSNLGADGVLGIDSLRSERVTFDFPKGQMTIVPSANAEQRSPGRETVVVTGKLKAGRLILTQASANKRAISVVIDTGSDASIGNPALRRRLQNSGLLHPVGLIQLQSVTGQSITGELMTIDEFEVGSLIIKDMTIAFADAPIFETLALHDRPALLLGMNTIRAFDRVSIDFASRKFRVVLPRKSSVENVRLALR
ncbi:MAG: retroviral-like aspartic protease family protein [Sphingomicrobium sp.]